MCKALIDKLPKHDYDQSNDKNIKSQFKAAVSQIFIVLCLKILFHQQF